jgi:hypothetical protein
MSSPLSRSSGVPARSEIALKAREAFFAEARPLRVVVLALGTLHAEPPVKTLVNVEKVAVTTTQSPHVRSGRRLGSLPSRTNGCLRRCSPRGALT